MEQWEFKIGFFFYKNFNCEYGLFFKINLCHLKCI